MFTTVGLLLYVLIFSNNAEIIQVDENEDMSSLERTIIYPGTKWCGTGDIAENENDFGEFEEADKCCKQHDKCPDVIEAFQSKYGLQNRAMYSRLHCDCDNTFHKCLHDVKDGPSSQIGYIYFNILNTKCFKEEYPIVGCKKYCENTTKCIEFIYDTNRDKKYQWFDVPHY